MSISDKVKDFVINWLNMQPATQTSVSIQETNTFEGTCFRNEIWYRGEASELHQYYTQIDDLMNNTRFWAAKSTTGVDFRKIHTGLPALIIDMLADIIIDSLNKIEITENEQANEDWEKIQEENNFKDLIKQAVIDVFVDGDGAFKISYDTDISYYPIIEFYSGAKVEYEYTRGKITAILFKTFYNKEKGNYVLRERYSKDGVSYELYRNGSKLNDLSELEETRNLQEVYDNKFMMAVPMMFNRSKKFKDRGQSVLDKKIEDFDSFDEVWSQWIEALRDNKTQTYVPEELLPTDDDGNYLKPNTWDNRYVQIGNMSTEEKTGLVIRVSGDFDYEKMLQGYITALDLCLQGLISPSTLGIDTKKLDNAEAQREKEKVTQYTRNKVIRVLEKVLPVIAVISLKAYDKARRKSVGDYKATANFGEYSSPSFEAVVETVSKARPGQAVMSIERSVEELYGDSLTDEEKAEEVKRLKEEAGFIEKEEPAIY